MSGNSDGPEFLAALGKGDSAAFKKVYEMHFGMVRHLITNNSGSVEDAHDIFQEAVVVLFEQVNSGRFEARASIKTWLYAVCRNKWLKQLEKRKRQVRLVDFEKVEPVVMPDEPQDDDQSLLLRQSLERLGEGCRKLLVLFYYFRKSMEEIAAEMTYTNADNAKSQKYKCLQKLKSIYATLDTNGNK
jgi:RNA polymerase sigma factor (sigma-70 family)